MIRMEAIKILETKERERRKHERTTNSFEEVNAQSDPIRNIIKRLERDFKEDLEVGFKPRKARV
jgi:hypothetical protein